MFTIASYNSTITLYQGVPFNANYEDTVWFETKFDREVWFQKYISPVTESGPITSLNITRVSESVVRVQGDSSKIRRCNYMKISNPSVDEFDYYCFISNTKYISEVVTEITFEVDPIQTFMFHMKLNQCLVEREHSKTDKIGENTLPENLELGPYVVTNSMEVLSKQLQVWVYTTEKVETTDVEWLPPKVQNNQAISCYSANCGLLGDGAMARVQRIVDALTAEQKSNAVISLFCEPKFAHGSGINGEIYSLPTRSLTTSVRNNKLYTYPFCLCTLVGEGPVQLRYENFSKSPSVVIRSTIGPNSEASCTPLNYNGMSEAMPYQVAVSDWPLLPYTMDSYQNWVARSKNTRQADTTTMTAGVIGTVVSAGAQLAVGHIGSAVSTIARGMQAPVDLAQHQMAAMNDAKAMPDSLQGNIDASGVNAWSLRKGFYAYCEAIKPEYAQKIDKYFDLFGYSANAVKVPNVHVRERWTYTKTMNSHVTGNFDAKYLAQIDSIFNRGIRFWDKNAEIGNYEPTNNPIGGV